MESLILRILISLGIGALIGIERERRREHSEFAGIRTFMLMALLGTLSVYVSENFPYFLLVAFIGLVTLIVASYVMSTKDDGDIGLTSEVAALLTFVLGAICAYGEGYKLAPIIAIIVTALLALKGYLHLFARRISEKEMIDTLKFLVIAFVILPLLPNTYMGPFQVFNPYQIWLMVVFISGISYAGYIAMKIIGPERGLSVTGIIGGLVSSTAVVTAMAGRVKESESVLKAAVFASVVASSMMFFRILFEVMVINPSLLTFLSLPLFTMGILGISLGLGLLRSPDENVKSDVKLKNPFSLKPAFLFGALFMVILFLSKAANVYIGNMGVYVAGIVSGVADVDAITVSMALLSKNNVISQYTAITTITLASISNTLVKLGIAFLFGTKNFGKKIGVVFGAVILAGLIIIILTGFQYL
ncbi:MAG TPA: MgtC/SapB family protein [Methanothermobacter sp.]|nr:MgtC/SapB family protein [Methanothermobacter sp.]HOK72276.1 MgtC/SapB family protein [Methanothermobacter sp.]HOL68922.1 MgtC/SapB family protein [Methanothermobacter sp.]HPQ04939.1 MgtC/SapB family protein [Methanothermobacter sp.]HPU37139.1 MgtC/SapB family protein [Methanothermobacter sp.]